MSQLQLSSKTGEVDGWSPNASFEAKDNPNSTNHQLRVLGEGLLTSLCLKYLVCTMALIAFILVYYWEINEMCKVLNYGQLHANMYLRISEASNVKREEIKLCHFMSPKVIFSHLRSYGRHWLYSQAASVHGTALAHWCTSIAKLRWRKTQEKQELSLSGHFLNNGWNHAVCWFGSCKACLTQQPHGLCPLWKLYAYLKKMGH